MAKIQCKMCGGELTLPEGVTCGNCEYCGNLVTFPKITSDQLENLYNRAEHFRRINDYDKAVSAYEKVINANPDDPEAYWGLVLSKYGIEYVEDPASHERIPTCHRVQFESILADADYLAVLENAGSAEKEIYEAEAARIAEIQKGILAISSQEEPFDVFLCYKESDAQGKRTRDSVIAQDIYYALQEEGLKVFFARITLEGKLGQQYEPYIFAALNSAKAMLVIGSKEEYFNAVSVRNEWSRYLALMKRDRKKLLIPCYRDMDAYDIPEELSMFQAQDMSKIGFIQDILHGVKKVAQKSEAPKSAAAPTFSGTGKANPLLRRAELFVESGDFDSTIDFCEKVLNSEPDNGWAYFYRGMAEFGISDEKLLINVDWRNKKTFQFAQRFADAELKAKIDQLIAEQDEAERKRREEVEAADTDRLLRENCTNRIDLLEKHLFFEKKLEKRQEVIDALKRAIDSENQLLQNKSLLTVEIAAPFEEYTKQALLSSGNLAEKEKSFKIKKVAKICIPIFTIILVFVLIVTINSCVTAKAIKRGDVCVIKDNVVTDLKYNRLEITKIVIPDGVTVIGDRAFASCSNLQSVTIPDSVTEIGYLAFSVCSSLQSVTIPDSVTKIGDWAFERCSSLQSLTIPDSVTTIGDCAFYNCSSLQSVTIGNSVTKIGDLAFEDCSSLQSVTIGNRVTKIGERVFSGCSSLQNVTIPDSVTKIGDWAFERCSSLQSLTIPDSVTKIGDWAFYNCSSLESVAIPDSVTKIGDMAFSGTALKKVRVPRNCDVARVAFPAGCKIIRY